MAKVNVKTDKAFKKLNAISKRFVLQSVAKTIEKEVVESIERGVSPVKGQGRFKKYSDSYRKQIKKGLVKGKTRARPVNLKQTGDLLRSFKVTINNNVRKIIIAFTDPKAEYHNNGTDKIPARRMLPTGNDEQFNNSIQNQIFKAVNMALRTVIKGFR